MAGLIHTPLGSLNINEVFVSFDGPRVFTCSNSVTKYLAFLVDELDETDHWFFVSITNIRIHEIKNGFISIKDALLNSESGIVFEVFLPVVSGLEATISTMRSSEIPLEFLPQDNSFILGQKDSTIQYYSELPQKKNNAVEEAIESARDIFDIALEMADDPYEMEGSLFGESLIDIQYTVFALDERWSNSKKPPISVVMDNTINVATLFQSSFGIRMKSKRTADIFRITPATNALRKFAELLQESNEIERLQNKLKSINPRAVLRYQKFLNTLKKAGASIRAEWAAPNQERMSVSLTKQQVDIAYEVTKQTEETTSKVTINGILYAVNLKKGTFFIEGDDDTEYSGELSEEIKNFVSRGHVFHIPMKVEAHIEVKVKMNLVTNTENYAYTLLDVYTINNSETKENGEGN